MVGPDGPRKFWKFECSRSPKNTLKSINNDIVFIFKSKVSLKILLKIVLNLVVKTLMIDIYVWKSSKFSFSWYKNHKNFVNIFPKNPFNISCTNHFDTPCIKHHLSRCQRVYILRSFRNSDDLYKSIFVFVFYLEYSKP